MVVLYVTGKAWRHNGKTSTEDLPRSCDSTMTVRVTWSKKMVTEKMTHAYKGEGGVRHAWSLVSRWRGITTLLDLTETGRHFMNCGRIVDSSDETSMMFWQLKRVFVECMIVEDCALCYFSKVQLKNNPLYEIYSSCRFRTRLFLWDFIWTFLSCIEVPHGWYQVHASASI